MSWAMTRRVVAILVVGLLCGTLVSTTLRGADDRSKVIAALKAQAEADRIQRRTALERIDTLNLRVENLTRSLQVAVDTAARTGQPLTTTILVPARPAPGAQQVGSQPPAVEVPIPAKPVTPPKTNPAVMDYLCGVMTAVFLVHAC